MKNIENFNISILVGLKNNLDYSKNFYKTTRSLYPNAEIIFVSYGSIDGTHEWLDSISSDENLIYFYEPEIKTFSDTYNKCIDLATKEYIVFLHNDMVLTPNFLENIIKHLNKNTVVGFSAIEPPIFSHDQKLGKIICDFGIDIEKLRLKELLDYSVSIQNTYQNRIENRIELHFFIALSKEILESIDGLDNLFSPMFCEDDDLFLRLEQMNLETKTSLDAICYHFVSKTSRFSEEIIKKTKEIEENSQRNFSRKWGFADYNDKTKTHDVAFLLKNGTLSTITKLEPYCTHLYTDYDFSSYIKQEQPKTKFDLSTRISSINILKQHEILVEIDGNELDGKSENYARRINSIINKKKNTKGLKGIIYRLLSRKKIRKGNILIRINY